jgi:hypothetical protein
MDSLHRLIVLPTVSAPTTTPVFNHSDLSVSVKVETVHDFLERSFESCVPLQSKRSRGQWLEALVLYILNFIKMIVKYYFLSVITYASSHY